MAIESEFELLQKQKQTFNDVRRGLMNLKAPIHILKAAYDREFRRAMNPLPFYAYRNEIIEKLTKNDIMILMGSTGSGKSTQIVQYLLEAGIAGRKRIVCTEPRKFAAISLCNSFCGAGLCWH
jgi:HrpA-like RNA helicase